MKTLYEWWTDKIHILMKATDDAHINGLHDMADIWFAKYQEAKEIRDNMPIEHAEMTIGESNINNEWVFNAIKISLSLIAVVFNLLVYLGVFV